MVLWDKAVARTDALETQLELERERYVRCYKKKRSLEAAAINYGVPYELIFEALSD